MIRHIYGLLYNSFLIFVTVQFCGVFCSKRKLKAWSKAIVVFAWLVLLSILSYTVDKVAIRLPIFAIIGMIGILFLYETSIKKALLFELFATFISLVSDFTVYLLLHVLEHQINVNNVFSNTLSYYFGVISMVIQIILLLIIERIFRKVDAKQITVNLWSRYLLVAIALVVMNMYVFNFLKNDISKHIENERLSMVYSNADEIQKMYQRLSNERDRLGKENHEFKNMVSVWSRLLKNREYYKLDELMDSASKAEHGQTKVFITGNETVDIILNDKFFEAAEKGINFVSDIKDLSDVHIKDEEIIVLLSNILNNAIESCESADKAVIFVKIAEIHGNFILSVKNSISGNINSDLGTTKADKLHHGYGIPNMKSIVAKHNGSFRTEQKDKMFATYIVIPSED